MLIHLNASNNDNNDNDDKIGVRYLIYNFVIHIAPKIWSSISDSSSTISNVYGYNTSRRRFYLKIYTGGERIR